MTLDETMLNQELENVDLSKITALQQKRTIAFINHFVLTNVQFFNNFLKKCEQNLMNFEKKLEKINAAMVLLEARLSSIPELGTAAAASSPDAGTAKPPEASTAKPTDAGAAKPSDPLTVKPPDVATSKPSAEVPEPPSKQKPNSQIDSPAKVTETVVGSKQARPEYDRFVKMVQVGVPLPAVKLKIIQEGLDPNVIDELLGK